MHELSIAESIVDMALRHVPRGAVLTAARVVVGPMRGIDPESLQWAWLSTLKARGLGPAGLELRQLLWCMHCPACDRRWESNELAETCPCGCTRPRPEAGDELQLVSIEVEDAEALCR